MSLAVHPGRVGIFRGISTSFAVFWARGSPVLPSSLSLPCFQEVLLMRQPASGIASLHRPPATAPPAYVLRCPSLWDQVSLGTVI